MTTPDQPSTRQPDRHLLIWARHVVGADGARDERPILLDEMVPEWRAGIENHQVDEPAQPRPGSDIVVISAMRALVIAALMEELSLRTRPGAATGPIRSDGSLSQLARDLARDMYRRVDRPAPC